LEECDFLDDICLTVLFASKDVSFAAVVDTNGKLIVGKYRKKVDRRLIATISIPDPSDQYQTKNCYFFYVDYLVTAIRQFYFESSSTRGEEEEKCEVDFDVININNKIKLAITPLTQCKDKFLCVYFESPVAESYQEIIMKINNTI
jgi:hypothetical protein